MIHETVCVDDNVSIGEGTRIWHFSHVMRDASIGTGCVLGQNVFVGCGVSIGNGVKIQNNVSIYEGVTIEDDVFCGPSCVFTNVLTPRAFIERKSAFSPTRVRRGATIGANATVVCGVTLGRYCLVGAGAVVTHDVPDYAMVLGVPARQAGWVCRCGTRQATCPSDEDTCAHL
jgi:UDP-2-acetamido-3-amino-2,3-dideoxy-glucuronate N-acetyltransferase